MNGVWNKVFLAINDNITILMDIPNPPTIQKYEKQRIQSIAWECVHGNNSANVGVATICNEIRSVQFDCVECVSFMSLLHLHPHHLLSLTRPPFPYQTQLYPLSSLFHHFIFHYSVTRLSC